jgi:hypothetical protein
MNQMYQRSRKYQRNLMFLEIPQIRNFRKYRMNRRYQRNRKNQ